MLLSEHVCCVAAAFKLTEQFHLWKKAKDLLMLPVGEDGSEVGGS